MVTNSETYEFQIISSFVKNIKNKDGSEYVKVVKPQAIYKLRCLTNDITSVSEAFNRNGDVSRNKCYVFHKDYKDLLVRGCYKKICDIVFPEEQDNKIGYGCCK